MRNGNGATRYDAARRPYWLLARRRLGYIETLTVEFDGVEALPVFSFEEEAELFLSLGVSGEGWEVRRSGAGEILSFLHGPCSFVHGVALDPVPECCGGSLLELMTVAREDFEDSILAAISSNGRKTANAVVPIRGSIPA